MALSSLLSRFRRSGNPDRGRCGEGPLPDVSVPPPEEITAHFKAFDLPAGEEHRVGPPPGGPGRGAGGWAASLAGALLDRATVRLMEPLFLWSDRPDRGGDVAARILWHRATYGSRALLEQPDRFFRPLPPPGRVKLRKLGGLPGGERCKLTFPSSYETFDPGYQEAYSAFSGNEINHVHLWRHHDGGSRPTAVLVNPWCSGWLSLEERLYQAPALYRSGFDVALFTLPFHGRRTPRQALFPGQLFPNRELRRTNEAFGQTVADLRALLAWLRLERGRPHPQGVIGMSLGGYVAALMACLEPDLAFAVPIMAPTSLADGLWQQGRNSPARMEAEEAGFTLDDLRHIWAVHCPLVLPLRIPRERLLLLWSEGDRVIPRVHVLALWERWGRPAVRSFPGGHLLQVRRGTYLREMRTWLEAIT